MYAEPGLRSEGRLSQAGSVREVIRALRDEAVKSEDDNDGDDGFAELSIYSYVSKWVSDAFDGVGVRN